MIPYKKGIFDFKPTDMRSYFLLAAFLLCASPVLLAGKDPSKDSADALRSVLLFRDSLNKALRYQTGTVALDNIAQLNVPKEFKFLNAEQSQYILTKLWGNPEDNTVLGMIFPANGDPFSGDSYAFVVSFNDIGYVKDDDADDIDYDKMLKDLQAEERESNKQREASGYPAIHMVGWAQKPFYDKTNKVLHWAKELRFGNEEENTLNYDIRVLGRKGILSLNAVGSMSQLPLVKGDIERVRKMATFTKGNQYSDFSSGTDKVAAWTIGGLVAGKILAKVGFFALILKFWKLLIAGIAAIFYAVKKKLTGKGKREEPADTTAPEDPTLPAPQA